MFFLESFPKKHGGHSFQCGPGLAQTNYVLKNRNSQPSLEQFPPHSTRQLYLLLHRRSMPQEKTLSKISAERSEKCRTGKCFTPNPVAHLFIIRENFGHLLISFAAGASLSLSVGKLLFFVLSSLKHQKNHPSRQDFPGVLISYRPGTLS